MNFKSVFLFIALAFTAALCAAMPEDRIQSLCDSLARQFPDSIAAPRLAVIPFADNTGKAQGQGVAEYVVTCLQKGKRFHLVDRMEFQKAITEIELANSDVVDSASALKVGKILSAPYILTGTISNIFGACKITAKIIRAETTEIMAIASITMEPSELEGITKDLLGERMQVSSTLFRSLVAPGWGQYYSHNYVRGTISLAVCLGALGYTIYMAQLTANANQKYHDYNNFLYTDAWVADKNSDPSFAQKSLEQDTLNYNDYSRKYDRMVLAGAITVGVWALNIVDAALCGAESKRKFKLYFSGNLTGEIEAGVAWKF